MPKVYLLDYVAGNIRSLVNAIEKVGYAVEWIRSPEDVVKADVSSSIIQSDSTTPHRSYIWTIVASLMSDRNSSSQELGISVTA